MSSVSMAKPTHLSTSRSAFSLMEVIVATAVLAAAGAALFALIGQASQLARKSQRRTEALQVATSVMDDAIAVRGTLREGETTAVYESLPEWQYRIVCESFTPAMGQGRSLSGATAAGLSGAGASVSLDAGATSDGISRGAGDSSSTTLWRVIVEVFPAGDGMDGQGQAALASDAQATVRLVRVVRTRRASESSVAASDSDSEVSKAESSGEFGLGAD
jgi:Tfp pilus assembly protein PilV